ncbi:hypothetical protein GWK47_041198 [Chionoecetes opilio]|uniref:Uncharacterized protein n=1 Tax=Chionoecetes opilio TaxID=41210 RepID=A0A8J4YH93_CHIOP|nr:hypothetical protein GWK47_041198 [Chionoecetes opilio]
MALWKIGKFPGEEGDPKGLFWGGYQWTRSASTIMDCAHVLVKVGQYMCSVETMRTIMRFRSRVGSDVLAQSTGVRAAIVTVRTPVRLLSSVNPGVLLEVSAAGRRVTAELTTVRECLCIWRRQLRAILSCALRVSRGPRGGTLGLNHCLVGARGKVYWSWPPRLSCPRPPLQRESFVTPPRGYTSVLTF